MRYKINLVDASEETREKIQKICFSHGIIWPYHKSEIVNGVEYLVAGDNLHDVNKLTFNTCLSPEISPCDFIESCKMLQVTTPIEVAIKLRDKFRSAHVQMGHFHTPRKHKEGEVYKVGSNPFLHLGYSQPPHVLKHPPIDMTNFKQLDLPKGAGKTGACKPQFKGREITNVWLNEVSELTPAARRKFMDGDWVPGEESEGGYFMNTKLAEEISKGRLRSAFENDLNGSSDKKSLNLSAKDRGHRALNVEVMLPGIVKEINIKGSFSFPLDKDKITDSDAVAINYENSLKAAVIIDKSEVNTAPGVPGIVSLNDWHFPRKL